MPGICVEAWGKSPGERILEPGLGQSNLRSLEIFGEPLNKGSPGSSCKGLDAEANSKGREITLEEDGGKSIDPFFYAQMQFNPEDVSKSIQQNGGFIQGIRPGKATEAYLKKISNRITLFGAIYLSLVAFIPSLAFAWASMDLVNVFSTTGILIVVSVAMEFEKQLQAQMMMKNYKGFLK